MRRCVKRHLVSRPGRQTTDAKLSKKPPRGGQTDDVAVEHDHTHRGTSLCRAGHFSFVFLLVLALRRGLEVDERRWWRRRKLGRRRGRRRRSGRWWPSLTLRRGVVDADEEADEAGLGLEDVVGVVVEAEVEGVADGGAEGGCVVRVVQGGLDGGAPRLEVSRPVDEGQLVLGAPHGRVRGVDAALVDGVGDAHREGVAVARRRRQRELAQRGGLEVGRLGQCGGGGGP
mmetsp:Transcript_20092/g.62146  ORF Transcript_20092/g.62146 Transcript_20092/m.62146 type:complete len:229 (-) Transcript_20092:1055-1741(-)